jgi:hypothetical protein
MQEMIPLSVLFETLAGVATLAGAAWGAWRFIDGKFERHRAEAEDKIEAVRKEAADALADHKRETSAEVRTMESKIDSLRAECATRSDIASLQNGISTLHRRIDEVLAMMLNCKNNLS